MTARLERLRGNAAPRAHDARAIAALTANPGCARRGLMDAAGVDKQGVARQLGFPAPFGQSQFAITRGNAFEAQIKADGCAQLLALLEERLGLAVPEPRYENLNAKDGREVRAARTRELFARALSGSAESTLVDHPLLRLDIGGAVAYLEPDVIALRAAGRFHVVEVKSFAVIDGQADPEQLAAAARQSAVYVLALRRLVEELGRDAGQVAHEVILVCPEGFSNRPTAAFVDVRKQLAVLERQLARMARVGELLDGLPDDVTFEAGERLPEAVRSVPARYAPDCMSTCEMAFFCRDEARACGSTDVLGRSVREEVGGLDSVHTVMRLAEGSLTPGPGQQEIAERLRMAARLRQEALR